ncbi:MAG: hypothetical protein QM756_14975 [Polyangiaceae bacterium]
MTQYILLIQDNLKSDPTGEEWKNFFTAAQQSGLFQGGSEIGNRVLIGDTESAKPTDHIVGFMRFDADDKQEILKLLELHPTVIHGGSVELCELPQS